MNIRLEIPLERLIGILRRTPTAISGRIAQAVGAPAFAKSNKFYNVAQDWCPLVG